MKTILAAILTLALISVITTTLAQEVTFPDPGLNAAIREALAKPTGPLTETDLLGLTLLGAGGRSITNVQGLEAARNLGILDLDNNAITNFSVANGLTNLTILDLFNNHLTTFVLSNPLPKLHILDMAFNSLAECALPTGLTNLATLFLEGNVLTNFNLPMGLSKLTQLDLSGNQLTRLTLPPDVTSLTTLMLDGNPLTELVLPAPLAASNLAATVTALQNQGIPVFTYPLTVQLTFPQQQPIGAFRFGITGPPGVYTVYASSNLTTWDAVNFVNNPLGGIFFTDTEAHLNSQRFFRAVRQPPPTNMVFIPATTFVMGSPTNDLDASVNERPQTTVSLTHGYWIGKHEVTQGEYESVMTNNPSTFIGDLSRPVENLNWEDATNYCAKLTERELAAGRIPPGSRYRLPTEAEWECAARAGTTTRFSYGDDPGSLSLTNYAWFLDLSILDLTTKPVAQKLPNPWGLYDLYGNVWEWCLDWYGPLPGGAVTDPTGPASNPLGSKVMRGGAYDFPNSSCRSASRLFQSHNDSDLGFRVVLVTKP